MFRVVLCALAAAAALVSQTAESPQVTAGRYCQGCHNDKLKTAGFSLDSARAAAIGDHIDVWEKVLHKVRSGEMPPQGLPKPGPELVTTLEAELDRVAAARPNPGAPVVHRLNRAEYSNAVRDLLGIDI